MAEARITLDHAVIAVEDWDEAARFYRDVCGAEVVERPTGYVFRFGEQQLNVHGPGVPGQPNARRPVQSGGADLCFRWYGAIDGAITHLQAQGVAVELGPVTRLGARGEGTSVYFRDPWGSLLEFISYER